MTKTIKNRPWSTAGVVLNDRLIRITADEDNGVMVAAGGTTIQGPMSIVASPTHIRIGGLWTFNKSVELTLPSTLATPAPVLLQDNNGVTESFQSIVEDVGFFAGLIGMIQGI